jgi:hypothetical protein
MDRRIKGSRLGFVKRLYAVTGRLVMAGMPACRPEPSVIVVGPVEFAAPAGSLAPGLAAAGDAVVLSWLEPAADGRFAFRTARRGAGGWEPAATVVESDALFVNWADVPSVQPGEGGAWLAHWLQRAGAVTYAYHVRMAVSPDAGGTWGPPFVPHADRSETEHGFAALVPWTDGWAALWPDGRATVHDDPMTLRFATIAAGGTPGPDLEVDPRVCDCCQTAVWWGRQALVSWIEEAGDGGEVRMRPLDPNGGAQPSTTVSRTWASRAAGFPRLVVAGDAVLAAWTLPGDSGGVRVAALARGS